MPPKTRGPQPRTPPRTPNTGFIEEDPETPPPARARINHLQGQVSELVRKEHVTARKHSSEMAEKDRIIANLTAKAKENEGLKRQIKLEGEGMRDELNLYSIVAQNKALLAVATEQMQIIEMEQRLLQAEAALIMRDHKMALFKAHQEDLEAERDDKDVQLEELEAALEQANTSLAHQRAAQTKASKIQESEVHEQIADLEAKVASLDARLKSSKEREKGLKEELDEALSEKGAGTVKETDGQDKEKRDLQKALRQAKAELADAQEELAGNKEASKERERLLKTKIRDAHAERDRLDLEDLRPKPDNVNVPKPKARKALTPSEDSDDGIYQKKSKKESPRKVKTVPAPPAKDEDVPYEPKVLPKSKTASVLRDLSDNDKLLKPKARAGDDKEPEKKKKKRKLFNAAPPAFTWDPVLNSGDGVIPAYLSPVAKTGKTLTGTIPRSGFSSMASSRSLGKF